MAPVAESIYELLTAAQRSVSGHARTAKRLWSLQDEHPVEFMDLLKNCIELAVGVTAMQVDRLLKFTGTFSQLLPMERKDQARIVLERIIDALLPHVEVESKIERCRACTVLGSVLNKLPDDVQFSEPVLKKYADAMVRCLDDKCPKVRLEAVQALGKLALTDACTVGTVVTKALQSLLTVEKNQVVRRAVIRVLPAQHDSIALIFKHTRDENHEVRKASYVVFRQMEYANLLSKSQRSELFCKGMDDQSSEVQQASVQMLEAWYHNACQQDVLRLIAFIDGQNSSDTAQNALRSLMNIGAVNLLNLVTEPPVPTLKQLQAPQMTTSVAQFWQIVCATLKQVADEKGAAAASSSGPVAEAAAADARQCNDVLEELLPEAEDLLQLIAELAAVGPTRRLAAQSLLSIAVKFTEWADGSIRASSGNLVQQLLKQDPCEELGTAPDAAVHGDSCLAGAGGSFSWERAVCLLAMKAYPEPSYFAQEMMRGIRQLGEDWNLLASDPVEEDADAAGTRLVQCLAWLSCSVQCLRDASSLAMEDASRLVTCGLTSALPEARRQAVCAIASWCMLTGAPSSSTFTWAGVQLLEALDGPMCSVQEIAVKAICNIMVNHGPASMDAACARLREGSATLPSDQPTGPTASYKLLELLTKFSLKAERLPKTRRANARTATDAACLDQEDARVACAIVVGMQKLLMYQYKWQDHNGVRSPKGLTEAQEEELMVALLLLNWTPLAAAAPNLQHINKCFWNVYTSCSPQHQVKICSVYLAAVAKALRQSTAKGTTAPELTGFISALLLQEAQDAIGGTANICVDGALESLALDLTWVLVQFSKCDIKAKTLLKPLATAALKALLTFGMNHCQPETYQKLFAMVQHLLGSVQERTLTKDLNSWSARVGQLQPEEEQADVMTFDEVCEEFAKQEHVQGFLAALHDCSSAGTSRRAPRQAAPARRRPAVIVPSDSDEDEDVDEVPVVNVRVKQEQVPEPTRRRSSRAAAQVATKKMQKCVVVVSDSDEDSSSESGSEDSDSEVAGGAHETLRQQLESMQV